MGKLTGGSGGRGGIATAEGLLKFGFKFVPVPIPPIPFKLDLKLIFGVPGIFGMLGGSILGSSGNSGSSGIDKLGRVGPKDGIGRLTDGRGGSGGIFIPDAFMPGILGKFGACTSGSLGNSGNSGRLRDGRESPNGGMGNSGIGIVKDFSETSLSRLNILYV